MDKWNGIEHPERLNTNTVDFLQRSKDNSTENGWSFTKYCWDSWAWTYKKVNLGKALILHKNNLKMDHRPKCKT